MRYTGEFAVYEDIIQEMALVYQHDKRPWMIGFSGGKDSTLLCCLVMEMLMRLPAEKRNKTVYIVSSDTMVENPIVRDYMHRMSAMINEAGAELRVKADIIYPKVEDSFWCKVIGLGYPTPEPPGFRWCTERLKINPMNSYTLNTIKNNGEVVLLLGVRKAESTYRANNIRAREIEGKLLVPHKDIENAYVYNPLTEIPNEEVWKFLLKGDAKSPWGSDSLVNLYCNRNVEGYILSIEIDKSSLSNGEKQIFIMALYHSLVQLCNHELPFIIDTPFARIDTEHRRNISEHFFCGLKGQVFILSTNEEINSAHVQIMKDKIAATYMLENTDNKRTVVVSDSYFEV